MLAAQHYVAVQLGTEVEMCFDVAEVIWQEGNFCSAASKMRFHSEKGACKWIFSTFTAIL